MSLTLIITPVARIAVSLVHGQQVEVASGSRPEPEHGAATLERYFFAVLQTHLSAGLLQPEQTLFSIGLPHFWHGVQPHV